jgi:hypothetical protein
MGHSQLETTRTYLDEIGIDDLADALARAAASRESQASTDEETEIVEAPEGLETLEWRRRESNPRKVPSAAALSYWLFSSRRSSATRPIASIARRACSSETAGRNGRPWPVPSLFS